MTTDLENINRQVTAEAALLKSMSLRSNYTNYWSYVNTDVLNKDSAVIGNDLQKYFDLYQDHEEVDWDLFTTQFCSNWHSIDTSNEDLLYYKEFVIPEIKSSEFSSDTHSCLLGVINKEVLEKINKLSKNGFSIDKVRGLLDDYEGKYNSIINHQDKDCFHLDEIDYSILDHKNGIPYFLPTLQKALGGLMAGNFVIVAADIGTGKSAFVISQAVHAFMYLHSIGSEQPILYFNSEDTLAEVGMRFFSNLHHKTVTGGYEQLVKDRVLTTKSFNEQYNTQLFKTFQLSGQGIAYVRNKLKKYRPSLVILDITDKLAPSEDVGVLKKLFDNLRDLAAEFLVPIIGTTQAGDKSYIDREGQTKNKKFLKSSDLYASKTGKGGSATVILSIGKDDEETDCTRYINISKKKRGEFARITATIEEKYSLYKEVF